MTEWVDTVERDDDVVTERAARAMHDLLDRDGTAPGYGDPLPVLWHWLAFVPQVRQADIGPDGHPPTGGFLPPMGGQRRMYAGGRVQVSGVGPRVGQRLERRSSVAGVRSTTGSSGPLSIVTVEHDLTADDGRIAERVDLVYSNAPPSAGSRRRDDVRGGMPSRTVPVDPTLLFRFSALTYNAHRIHYDRDYATAIEGYPGLVVQGPLQAILLADLVDRCSPGRRTVELEFRAVAPAFDDHPLEISVVGASDADHLEAVVTSGGRRTMVATATLDEESG